MTLLACLVIALAAVAVTFECRALLALDRGPAMAIWIGFSPLVLQLGWLGLGIALLTGTNDVSWWLAFAAAALSSGVGLAGLRQWWRATAPGVAEPDAPGIGLRVVTANVFYRNEEAVLAWPVILRYKPDVVVLQEVSAVSGGWLPPDGWHCVSDLRPDAFGTAILSREPITRSSIVLLGGLPQLRAVVRHQGREVVVYSVHPRAPASRTADVLWRKQFRELTTLLRAESSPHPVVVGGDFNATPLHRPFRTLLAATGFIDARPPRRCLGATWPSGGAGSVAGVPLVMALDHVLVRGAVVRGVTILPATSGDHFPIGVEIALPG